MSAIGEPLTLPNSVILENRIVKSAMSEALADVDNNPTPALSRVYRLWGQSGAALLITGNIQVDRMHLEHAANLVLDRFSDLSAVAELASGAKAGGSRILAQLSHAGRQTPLAINSAPRSISDVPLELPGYGQPVALADDEMAGVVDLFVRSALSAQEAGFDGVEIHAAHGWLLSSSLSPRINDRSDVWGGIPLENRSRLTLEVVRAVRSAADAKTVVAVKLNSSDFQKGGFDQEDSARVAGLLQDEGVDFIEISGGNFESPKAYQHTSRSESTATREAYFLDYAADIKSALDIPLMVTGGFRSATVMNESLAQGRVDLIGMGRPFIVEPNFPRRLLQGQIDSAPTIERDLPPADQLPRGAVLNWFCAQLALLGETGSTDLDLPVLEGHQRYLDQIDTATHQLVRQRSGI